MKLRLNFARLSDLTPNMNLRNFILEWRFRARDKVKTRKKLLSKQ